MIPRGIILLDMRKILLDIQTEFYDSDCIREGIRRMAEVLKDEINLSLKSIELELIVGFFPRLAKIIGERDNNDREIPVESYLDPFLENLGIEPSERLRKKLLREYYRAFAEKAHFSGNAEEVFRFLRNQGWKIRIVSNTLFYGEIFKEIFDLMSWDQFIDRYCFSYDVGSKLPHRTIFKKAIDDDESTSDIPTVMVGNSIYRDLTPAKKYGLKTIWIKLDQDRILNRKIDEKPDFILNTFDDIIAIEKHL